MNSIYYFFFLLLNTGHSLPKEIRSYISIEFWDRLLVNILENGFKELPEALDSGKRARVQTKRRYHKDSNALVTVLLGDNPQLIVNALLDELKQGTTEEELANIVCYASALRIAQFHTQNEFSDWDIALHTFTFANAVHQGLRRVPTIELLRGVFDAAMRIYLNRFLNIPPATLFCLFNL